MKRTYIILLILLFTFLNIFSQTIHNNASLFAPRTFQKLNEEFIQKKNYIMEFLSGVDTILTMAPVSVMEKPLVPPSGDKHDYVSMGTYWWPDPSKPGGVPYIRKDGMVNPEIKTVTDYGFQKKMIYAVEKLIVAYGITKDEKYSRKAASLLRTWFLDEKTKMNPNLNFAQFIKGVNTGRGTGIIDTDIYYKIFNVIGILESSKAWTKEDDTKLRAWFREYLLWLTTSKNGLDEKNAHDNHGTWYDVQVVSIAIFLNKNEFAKEVLKEAITKRFPSQIDEDGEQFRETQRTKSWTYSAFNLRAYYILAKLADNIGMNFWQYGTEWQYNPEEKPLLQTALDYILPAAYNPKEWKKEQIVPIEPELLYPLLLIAESKYDSVTYSNWLKKIFGNNYQPDLMTKVGML